MKDNLEDTTGGQGIMKEEIKKMECALFIITCIFNIAKLPGKNLQMVGQGSGILEFTQGELGHVGQDWDVLRLNIGGGSFWTCLGPFNEGKGNFCWREGLFWTFVKETCIGIRDFNVLEDLERCYKT